MTFSVSFVWAFAMRKAGVRRSAKEEEEFRHLADDQEYQAEEEEFMISDKLFPGKKLFSFNGY